MIVHEKCKVVADPYVACMISLEGFIKRILHALDIQQDFVHDLIPCMNLIFHMM